MKDTVDVVSTSRYRARYLNSKAWLNRPIADFGGGVAFPADNFLSGLGLILTQTILPNFDALQQTFISHPEENLTGAGFRTSAMITNGVITFDQDRYTEDLNPRQTVQPRPRTTRGGNGKLDPTTAVQFDVIIGVRQVGKIDRVRRQGFWCWAAQARSF